MERNNNIDFLRVTAAFMVIILHVSASFVTDNIDAINYSFTVGNFYDSVTRFCVPLFILISGGLNLSNKSNKNFSFFYNKTMKKIIIPIFIWSIFYVFFNYVLIAYGIIIHNYSITLKSLLSPIYSWALGAPFYHMWYVYMIMGLYAITPFVIRIIEEFGDRVVMLLGFIFLILGFIVGLTSDLFWMIQFIQYLGYYMLGYTILTISKNQKVRTGFNWYLLFGVVFGLLIFITTQLLVKSGFVQFEYLNFGRLYFYSYLSPFVILGSLSIYKGFLSINNIKIKFYRLASHTFNIYLIHAAIIVLINAILFSFLQLSFNPLWFIPVCSIVVFTLSFISSDIIQQIMKLSIIDKIKRNLYTKIDRIFDYFENI